ncbi:MAG: DUF349 domain-containing protein, partial [Bacteroidaceae bacterium]|nr:DUF349 domain-containing protein [Bacteroidaceae bacterium]
MTSRKTLRRRHTCVRLPKSSQRWKTPFRHFINCRNSIRNSAKSVLSKELREEIWNRFKEASTVVNKRHQAHFEALKAREEENLVLKTALCERVEAIDVAALNNNA